MFNFIANISESNAMYNSNVFINLGQLLFFIIAFMCVLFLSIYVTKLVATSSYLKSSNKNIKILESIGVGYQNSVQLLKVGRKYVLIGNTKENITLLLDLKEDDIALIDIADQDTNKSSFRGYLDKYLLKKDDNKDSKDSSGDEDD